ncbi:MAG: hypothetical protein CL872_02755 [Dehalococcoidaceae bacterium]|nr:hypothetical protein [Dehalococcoidaceae bacterium]
MLILLSPSKTLDFSSSNAKIKYTQPRMLAKSKALIKTLQKKDSKEIASLMNVSDKIALLNAERFKSWQAPFTMNNAKQAIFAFQGDVYEGLDALSFDNKNIDFAQKHLRILSGLYGLLRPLDLMQPYRLEMGTQLKHKQCANLYEYWGKEILNVIEKDLNELKNNVVINLASMEYFKAIHPSEFSGRIVNPIFKDTKNGKKKIISFYAKKARGLMSQFIIKNKITSIADIREFNLAGYQFDAASSSENDLLFTRTEAAAKLKA